jgi:hypothetical protein
LPQNCKLSHTSDGPKVTTGILCSSCRPLHRCSSSL